MTNEHRELTTEILGKQKIFTFLVSHLRFNKPVFTAEETAYIEETLYYFDDVKDGLKLISERNFPEQDIQRIAPNQKQYPLREIFEAISGEEKPTLELIVGAIEKLDDAQEYLKQLQKSPVDFYQTKGSNELLDVCQKFRQVYDQLA